MADITDVMSAIITIIDGAIYPNGDTQASAMPGAAGVKMGRGWPLPADLDASIAAGQVQVTLYPLSGAATPTYQLLERTDVITPAAITTTVGVAGDVITVGGTLSAGEFLTVVVDNSVVCSQTGANVAAMLTALAAEATSKGIVGASSTPTTLTLPFGRTLTVRQGGQALLGRVSHRQRHSIMVCVWAPSDTLREAAAILADVALKKNNKITLPDTSQCILRYLRTTFSDQQEKALIYRRDLIYDAEYATLETFPGYTITSADITIAKPDNSAIATAIT